MSGLEAIGRYWRKILNRHQRGEIAPQLAPPGKPPVTVLIGDSITEHNGERSRPASSLVTGWMAWANALAGQRVSWDPNRGNYGVSGDTSDMVLARIEQVMGSGAERAILLIGTNDIGKGIDLRTLQSNVLKIVHRLVTAGIRPYLCTLTPRSGAPPKWYEQSKAFNTWIAQQAKVQRCGLLDFNSALSEPDQLGVPLAGVLCEDGLHLSPFGAQMLGSYLADQWDDLPSREEQVLWNLGQSGQEWKVEVENAKPVYMKKFTPGGKNQTPGVTGPVPKGYAFVRNCECGGIGTIKTSLVSADDGLSPWFVVDFTNVANGCDETWLLREVLPFADHQKSPFRSGARLEGFAEVQTDGAEFIEVSLGLTYENALVKCGTWDLKAPYDNYNIGGKPLAMIQRTPTLVMPVGEMPPSGMRLDQGLQLVLKMRFNSSKSGGFTGKVRVRRPTVWSREPI